MTGREHENQSSYPRIWKAIARIDIVLIIILLGIAPSVIFFNGETIVQRVLGNADKTYDSVLLIFTIVFFSLTRLFIHSPIHEEGRLIMNLEYKIDEQRKRAWGIIWTMIILLLLSFYLFMDVRLKILIFKAITPENGRWLEWLFASTSGTTIYLLWEIARYFRKIDLAGIVLPALPDGAPEEEKKAWEEKNKKILAARENADFKKYTPWYIVTAIRGPIIVLVVLFALTNITLSTSLNSGGEPAATETPVVDTADPETGAQTASPETTPTESPLNISLNMAEAPQEVLVIIAFILGFYNRLPVELLESIAKSIFPEAWKEAYEEDPEDNPEPNAD